VKVAIHPSQLAVIRARYAPSADQVDWARKVLAAATEQRGVFTFGGMMVDAPVLRRAESIARLANLTANTPDEVGPQARPRTCGHDLRG
jgi:citrate lyase subunit beta/citryl-CoA lyase